MPIYENIEEWLMTNVIFQIYLVFGNEPILFLKFKHNIF